MSIEEFAWPSAFVLVVLIFVFGVGSCIDRSKERSIEEAKVYTGAGCEKQPITGDRGTHWVCKG